MQLFIACESKDAGGKSVSIGATMDTCEVVLPWDALLRCAKMLMDRAELHLQAHAALTCTARRSCHDLSSRLTACMHVQCMLCKCQWMKRLRMSVRNPRGVRKPYRFHKPSPEATFWCVVGPAKASAAINPRKGISGPQRHVLIQ